MRILLSTIGQRGYIARYFRAELPPHGSVIGTGNTEHTPGFRSCDSALVVPDITDPDYPDRVLKIVESERVDAMLTLSDTDLGRISSFRSDVEALGVAAFFPDQRQAEISLDKLKTHDFLVESGFRTPATTDDPAEALRWGPPLIVKPRSGSASLDTFLARTTEEIRFFMGYRADMIAQEFVDGAEYNVEVCGDLAGRPIRACVWRKHESRRGETALAETVDSDEALTTGLELAGRLGIPGPIDIDLILAEGRPAVLEVNARFGGGYPTSHMAGANFVRALVDLTGGRTVEADFGYERGVVMMKELHPFAHRVGS